MAKRQRTLTDADKRAAKKVRELWDDFKKHNPGVSQEVAAARAGMGQSAFSQFLRGTVPMRVAPVVKFAKLFGVDPKEIRPDIELAYASSAVSAVREPEARYDVSTEALSIARAFDQLQPQAKEFIREQVFIYTVIDKSFPWLRRGRPVGTRYEQFEKWHQDNISIAIKRPRRGEKAKR